MDYLRPAKSLVKALFIYQHVASHRLPIALHFPSGLSLDRRPPGSLPSHSQTETRVLPQIRTHFLPVTCQLLQRKT